jgi:hypothetical protein
LLVTVSQLSVDVPHSLTCDEAARRFKERIAAARAEYRDRLSDFREEWRDHTVSFAFRTLGLGISGTIAVEQDKVRLAADVPLAAMIFRGTIEKRIREEVGRLLAVSADTDTP